MSVAVGQRKVYETLECKMTNVEETVMWHCGLTKEEVFWAIVDAGRDYLRGRVNERDYKMMLNDKGFWHWYKQIWCMSANWLIDANQWYRLDRSMDKLFYDIHYSRKDFASFNKYLRAKIDCYSFEPVLIAMYHRREYDGRVFW